MKTVEGVLRINAKQLLSTVFYILQAKEFGYSYILSRYNLGLFGPEYDLPARRSPQKHDCTIKVQKITTICTFMVQLSYICLIIMCIYG